MLLQKSACLIAQTAKPWNVLMNKIFKQETKTKQPKNLKTANMKRSLDKLHFNNNHTRSIDFLSTNNDLIVCGCRDGTVSLISSKTKNIVWTHGEANNFEIFTVKVSPNRDVIAVGGYKQCLSMIDAFTGKLICSIYLASFVGSLLFLSQEKIVCGLANGIVVIVCWQSQKIETFLKVGEKFIYAMDISPTNSDILITGHESGAIKQKNFLLKKTVMTYDKQESRVENLKFLSCGTMFVAAIGDETAQLFALNRKKSIRVFEGHTDFVHSVFPIFDDRFLITVSAAFWNTVKLWEMKSGKCLATFDQGESQVVCAALSKDETSLVIGGFSGNVALYSCPLPPPFAVSLDRTLKLI